MSAIYVYDCKELPEGFSYPDVYLQFAHDSMRPTLEPWWLLCDMPAVAQFWLDDLKRQYPSRALIPFAKLEDTDDLACFDGFDTSGNPRILYIHAFSSVGWEERGVDLDFDSWLERAARDHQAYVADRGGR